MEARVDSAEKVLSETCGKRYFTSQRSSSITTLYLGIPPLRDRLGDLPALIFHFAAKFSDKAKIKLLKIDPVVLSKLSHYNWPGNVRELENTIGMAVLHASQVGVLKPEHIDLSEVSGPFSETPCELDEIIDMLADVAIKRRIPLRRLNNSIVDRVLEKTGGNISRASQCINVGKTKLYERLSLLRKSEIGG